MKFVALVSGGKDSIYSILHAIQNGHELIACVHLGAPLDEENDEESYMYQTAASEVVKTMIEECLGVDLLLYPRRGKSVNTGLVYENTTPKDEVEDLYLALQQAVQRYPSVEAVCSGAILSTYQRVRIEHVCNRLGLASLSYLWRMKPQKELLRAMLDDGIEAVLVKVACPPGLVPRKHLNKSLRYLSDIGLLERLNTLYQFHVCGEGGEYESLVIDSPLHKKKLILDEVEIIENDCGDGVGELRILSCHAEDKIEGDIPLLEDLKTSSDNAGTVGVVNQKSSPKIATSITEMRSATPSLSFVPPIHKGTGGFLHFGEILSPVPAAPIDSTMRSEAELAVEEALQIFSILQNGLDAYGATSKDVLYVHLYLSEISHFTTINAHYQAFFGSLLPPSRSCVALGKGVLPGGRRVLLDCKVQIGSGEYMRSSSPTNPYAVAAHKTKTCKLREVLHVQSISNWAPVCVGPYSQVNTLRSGIQFLAGQIGLVPQTMELQPTWDLQLQQCWKNIASVLDALNGGSLRDLIGSLIYVSSTISPASRAQTLESIKCISTAQIRSNGSIMAGMIDSLLNETELYGGYEDQETWEEMKTQEERDAEEQSFNPCPILVVTIPEMPKGALIEVEVITSTVDAARSLETRDAQFSSECKGDCQSDSSSWDSGHDFPISLPTNQEVRINSSARVIGNRSAASAIVTASVPNESVCELHLELLFRDMLSAVTRGLSDARSGLTSRNMIHVRLFYVACESSADGKLFVRNDGVQLRSFLAAAIASQGQNNQTATSVVPVEAIDTIGIPVEMSNISRSIMFAMQILHLDPVHLETEIWIHKDR